jgi:uncharacterized protein (UPF0261 family)
MHRAAADTVSPKVLASTVASLAVSVLLAIVLAFVDHPEQLAGLPSWARFVLVAALPSVATALAGYRRGDPLRDLGATQLDATTPGDTGGA